MLQQMIKRLLDCLKGRRNDYKSVYAITIAANDIINRAHVYCSQQQELQKMILNKITINQLIQSSKFQPKAQPAFSEILKLLFVQVISVFIMILLMVASDIKIISTLQEQNFCPCY